MRIQRSWTYDAPIERVYAMTIDPRFQEAKCRHASAVGYSSDVTRVDGRDTVVVERSMATDGLPSQMRSFIGGTIHIVERQVWPVDPDQQGRRVADLRVEVKSAPVAFTGTITMTRAGDRTAMHAEGDLRAKVPLLGAKIEEAAAPAVTGAIEMEQQAGREFLAG